MPRARESSHFKKLGGIISPKVSGDSLRIGDVSNNVSIASSGQITLVGTGRVIIGEDIDLSIPKRPLANPPNEGTEDGFPTLDFDDGTDESILITYHLKHKYVWAGLFHVHLDFFVDTAPAVAENIVWGLEYKRLAHGDNFDFSLGTSTLTTKEAVTTGTPANDKKIHETGDFSLITTGWECHDIILMRLFRDADDAVNDDFTGDARLLHIHVEYLADKLGEVT